MSAIYEVEFPAPAPGQRLCRHVMAESEEEAVIIANERQQLEGIAVRKVRDCRPGERERPAIVGGDIATVVLKSGD